MPRDRRTTLTRRRHFLTPSIPVPGVSRDV
jgi:hypothetical protein